VQGLRDNDSRIIEKSDMDQIVSRAKALEDRQAEAPTAALALGRAPRRRRWLGWLVTILVVAAIGGAAYWWLGSGTSQAPTFATEAAQKADITVKVTATGTLQPVIQTDVSSELSGVVRTVDVVENQSVAKGQVLATLDTTRLLAQVERAEANVKAAEAKVSDAATTLKETENALARATSLSNRKLVADQALETATAARDRAKSAGETADANLAIARADLKLQEADLAKSTIYSPIDGVVLTRDVDPGQTVAASFSAPILFVIAADLSKMELEAAIDEADIGSVEKEQRAQFTVDAFPGRIFDASIRDIAYAAVTTEGVVTYEAKLTVDNRDLLLRPGMTATVAVVTKEAKDVLAVPNEAFRFRPPVVERSRGFSLQSLFMPPRMGRNRPPQTAQAADGSRTLYVLRGGEPRPVRVRTGVSDGERTEILSGLEPGDEVIVSLRQPRAAR